LEKFWRKARTITLAGASNQPPQASPKTVRGAFFRSLRANFGGGALERELATTETDI